MPTESIFENASDSSIGIVGAGYVGLVTGACFSTLGTKVSILEIDNSKIKELEAGRIPIFEPGLEEIVRDSREKGHLVFFSSAQELCQKSRPEIIFIAVGTPERPDGSCNTDYVIQAAQDIAKYITRDTVLVIKSTVPVGTASRVKAMLKELPLSFKISVVNNPEFLKEGEAVADFMKPERVVIGGTDNWAVDKVKALYDSFLHNGHPLFVTDHETAELSKLSANLVLASRISIINQISQLSSVVGADIRQVEKILLSDSRIGSRYLFSGLGYGGSCFPKDVKNFIHLCREKGVDSRMAETVDAFNEDQKIFFVEDILKNFKPGQDTIAILGLGFKPNTDDIREGPALSLTRALTKKGFHLKGYDPKASRFFSEWLNAEKISGFEVTASLEDCLRGASAMVLVTEWQEFQRLGQGGLKRLFKGRKVYDGKNIYSPSVIKSYGFEYKGVGRS
jgi:UDPglucose 6-dehydrogenase